jgi:hypothetical protein
MNVECLEQLKRVVRERPDELFDMSIFGRKTSCGTVCCAAGSAALDPWFLANTGIALALPVTKLDSESFVFNFPFGMDDRLADVFGISKDYMRLLFYEGTTTSRPVTKEMVIANIDRILAGGGPVPYYNNECEDEDEDEDYYDEDDE